jgi:hypothetical protein
MKKFLFLSVALFLLAGCNWFGMENSVKEKLPDNYTMTMHDYQFKVVEDKLLPYGVQQWDGYFGSFYEAYTDPVTGVYTPPVLALSHFKWYPVEYGPDFWNDCGVDYIDNYTFDTYVYHEENGIVTVENFYGRDWHGRFDEMGITFTSDLGTVELKKLEKTAYDGSLDSYINNLLNR